jgi:hypothetical protein
MARKPSRHVGTIGDIAGHGYTLTLNCERCRHRGDLDLPALIAANGEDYLLRKVVDRAVCSKCGGVEISCTLGVASATSYSYPDYSKG